MRFLIALSALGLGVAACVLPGAPAHTRLGLAAACVLVRRASRPLRRETPIEDYHHIV